MNQENDFMYRVVTSRTDPQTKAVTIQNYRGKATEVTIPEKIGGLVVECISNTFQGNYSVKKVTLPSSLLEISAQTFTNCHSLKAVVMSESVVEIGAFSFANCRNLQSIYLPEGLMRIKHGAFQGCISLETVKLPESLRHIGFDSFNGCFKLFQVSCGNQFDFLGSDIFLDCPKLKYEDGFLQINSCIFAYHGKKTEITVPEGVTHLASSLFKNKKSVTAINLPKSLQYVGAYAFSSCENITEIVLTEAVREIPEACFCNCKSLEKVHVSEHLSYIGEAAFGNCSNLKEFPHSTALKQIQKQAFQRCFALERVDLPETLEVIERHAFAHCRNLKELRFPSSVKKLLNTAFTNCEKLETVDIYENQGKLLGKKQSTALLYQESFLHVSENVVQYWKKDLQELFRLKQLKQWAELSQAEQDFFRQEWANHSDLCRLVFQQGSDREVFLYFQEGFLLDLVELDEYLAFSIENNTPKITAMLLEHQAKHFSQESLESYKNNKELVELGYVLPTLAQFQKKWVCTEGENCLMVLGYRGKNSLEQMPEQLEDGTAIDFTAFHVLNAFYQGNLRHHFTASSLPFPMKYLNSPKNFEPLEQIACANGDLLLLTNEYNLSQVKILRFPENFTEIRTEMFYQCNNIKEVEIHNFITEIGSHSFQDCHSLKKITFSSEIPRKRPRTKALYDYKGNGGRTLLIVEESAFRNCHSLEEVIFPERAQIIREFAFADCPNLKRVIFNSEYMKIEENSFENCPSLEFMGLENGKNLLDCQ